MALSRVGSASVARLFARGTPTALALLRAAWPAAVGPELARRTEVLALEGAALRVRVPDARWRKVLHRMQPEILTRLRRVAGELAPRRLGFTEGGIEIPEPRAVEEPPREIPYELPEGLAVAARVIDDPELRARFERSAARYLAVFRHS